MILSHVRLPRWNRFLVVTFRLDIDEMVGTGAELYEACNSA